MLLALDLSSKSTGAAVFDDNKKLVYVTTITASSTDMIERVEKITKDIKKICDTYHPTIVVMEEVLPKPGICDDEGYTSGPNILRALYYMQASVNFMLHHNYPTIAKEFVMPNSWRAKLGIKTGRGVKRATLKQSDMEWVKKTYNLTLNDDAADAVGIGASWFEGEPKTAGELNWG